MRIGLLEMKRFSLEFFPGTQPDTFVQESAGVADLITSCLGGRNHKVAAAFVTKGKVSRAAGQSRVSSLGWVRLTSLGSARSRSRTSRRRCSTARSSRVRGRLSSLPVWPCLLRDPADSIRFRDAGVETAKELYHFLETRGRQDAYPLFTFVVRLALSPLSLLLPESHVSSSTQYRVAYEGVKPDTITAHI